MTSVILYQIKYQTLWMFFNKLNFNTLGCKVSNLVVVNSHHVSVSKHRWDFMTVRADSDSVHYPSRSCGSCHGECE